MIKRIAVIVIGLMVISLSACATQELGEDNTMIKEKEAVKSVVSTEEQAEDILEIVHSVITNETVTGAEKYSDDVGSGLQIKMDTGRVINVYIDKTGMIYGIKDIETGEYLYAVYE